MDASDEQTASRARRHPAVYFLVGVFLPACVLGLMVLGRRVVPAGRPAPVDAPSKPLLVPEATETSSGSAMASGYSDAAGPVLAVLEEVKKAPDSLGREASRMQLTTGLNEVRFTWLAKAEQTLLGPILTEAEFGLVPDEAVRARFRADEARAREDLKMGLEAAMARIGALQENTREEFYGKARQPEADAPTINDLVRLLQAACDEELAALVRLRESVRQTFLERAETSGP